MESATVATDQQEALPSACLSDNLSWLLSQAHYALAREVQDALAPLEISGRSVHVLKAAMTGEHSQTELAEMVGLDKTTMVVTMDELESRGLAERRPSDRDRRARVIVVTKAGERKVKQAKEVMKRVETEVLESLPARQREQFLAALIELVTNRFADHVVCSPQRRREPR